MNPEIKKKSLLERLWSQHTAILIVDCIKSFTVNIWGQSEGIERTILPSVGIFDSNLNVQIDFRLVSDFQTFPRHRTLSLINYFFAAFLSCCPRIITWLQSQSSMKTLVKGNRLETWLWIWEKLKKFGSTFTYHQ